MRLRPFTFLSPSTPISSVLALNVVNVEPLPADSKELTGYSDYYRVDTGEYRIVYRFTPSEDLVEIVLVGKRNDDEVYKQLNRLLGEGRSPFIKSDRHHQTVCIYSSKPEINRQSLLYQYLARSLSFCPSTPEVVWRGG
ncbi:MAG: type II toxin-antitoxin system RelE/ParE family toxin [Cyanobacteria bacterium CRU_2_1]|nr:type II toxin-antitoxin system RelE/ParE family toxin [Cyanobacteria bacterium RU_5_0]NJR58159.1 type II toxin-antitoxin system RelE/ParE family toxin [Cyanobacteria bacterium CRU_2_1]